MVPCLVDEQAAYERITAKENLEKNGATIAVVVPITSKGQKPGVMV